MNDQRTDDRPRHDRALDLAATAIDFDLSRAEASELNAHVATCPSCTRRVAGLRADAHVLSRPLTLLPSPRVDAAVAAAIARRPDRPQRLLLLAAAALVLLGLLGIAAAGASLLRSIDPPSITVLPSPPVIVADASPGLDASPAVVGDTWETIDFPASDDVLISAIALDGTDLVGMGRGRCDADNSDPTTCFVPAWTAEAGQPWTRVPEQDGLRVGLAIPLSGPEKEIVDMAAGPTGLVAIGYAFDDELGGPRIWQSPDGRTWQRNPFAFGPSGEQARFSAIAASSRGYVIVGRVFGGGISNETLGARAAAWISSDGITWERAADTERMDVGPCLDTGEEPSCGGMRAVVATPDGYVAVGDARTGIDGQTSQPAAWTSPDGLTWTRSGDAGLGIGGGETVNQGGFLSGVTVGGPGLIAVGTICRPDCFGTASGGVAVSSANGSTWTATEVTGAPMLQDVTTAGGQVFALGSFDPDGDQPVELQLWRSDDGVTWQRVPGLPSIPDLVSFGAVDIAGADDRLVIAGWAEVSGADPLRDFTYVSPPAGSVVTPSPTPSPSGPVASLPTGMIAYVVGPVGSGEVRVVSADGTGDVSCGIGSAPSWSTDGRTIFFAGPPTATADGFPDTFRADADCTGITKAITEALAPHVSPDGRRIAFRRGMIDLGEAWIADADGSNQRRLPASSSPTWSPDGAWLLAQHVGVVFEVGVMRPDGTDYTALGSGYDPSWTPAGGIVYARSDFPAATTTIRTVTLDGLASDQFTGSGEIHWPQMLASGQIVFVLEGDVWRLGPGSSAPARLTQGLQVASRPSLSPDGAWVALATGGTDPGLAIVSLDGAVERLRSGAISDVVWHGSPSGPVASSIDPVVLLRVDIGSDTGGYRYPSLTVYRDGTVLNRSGRMTRLTPTGMERLTFATTNSGLFLASGDLGFEPGYVGGAATVFIELRRGDEIIRRSTPLAEAQATRDEALRIIALAERLIDHESWLPADAWAAGPASATVYAPSHFLMQVTVEANRAGLVGLPALDVADVEWPLPGRMETFGVKFESPFSSAITRCGVIGLSEGLALERAIGARYWAVHPNAGNTFADLAWGAADSRVTIRRVSPLPGEQLECTADALNW